MGMLRNSIRNTAIGLAIALAFLAILYALSGGRAFGAPARAPYVAQDVGDTRNGDSVRRLVVKNPLRRAVLVEVWCRQDPRSVTEAVVLPSRPVTFELASDRPLAAGDCGIYRWRR